MADYGLTDAGFMMPTYDNLTTSYANAFKNSYGSDLATSEDTMSGMLIRILAYTDYTLWEAAQGIYNSQTLNGAEGIYLDDIMSQRGIFRKSATAGNGYAVVKSDKSASWTRQITEDTYFNASNGLAYHTSTPTSLRSNIGAYTITKAQATSINTNTVTFYARNNTTGANNSVILTPSDSSFLTDLQAFFRSNLNVKDTSKVFINGSTLYLGFNSADLVNPVGLSSPTRIYASANLGVKWSLIPVEGVDTGINSVNIGEITSISSTFSGYISSTNFTQFRSGTDIETDAQLRSRFNDEQDEATAATRPAIVKALLDLNGVTKVRIYDNPTRTDNKYTPSFTFNTVVTGGESNEIATALYKVKPINTLTYGSTSITVDTEDGDTEVISFTQSTVANYSLRINYTTASETELTNSEKASILSALTSLEANFDIGSVLSNGQIKGVVYSAIAFGRLTSLRVYVKLTSEGDNYFTEKDITPDFSTIPSLDTDNISYNYVISN